MIVLKHRQGETTQGSITLKILEEHKKKGTKKLDLSGLNKY